MTSRVSVRLAGLIALGFAASGLSAQRIRRSGPTELGLFGGTSIGTMTGKDVIPVASRKGFTGGLVAILPFTENFSLRTGISFVQKGVSDSLTVSTGVYQIGYVEFPFVFRMIALPGDDVQLHALAGFAIGFRTSCSFRVDSVGVGTVYPAAGAPATCGKSLRKFAFDVANGEQSWMAGLNLTLLPNRPVSYDLAVTYELGISHVDPAVEPLDANNRVFAITAGVLYSFH